jgi:hypothetical protein
MEKVEKTIRVVVKKAGQAPSIETIKNDLQALHTIVGGYIEMPYHPELGNKLRLVCNEEGKFINGNKPNVHFGANDIVFGDILFVGVNDAGYEISLTEKQIKTALDWIKKNDASSLPKNNGM